MSNSPDSILITGGCGFVGLNLLGYLLKQEAIPFRILDNLSVGTRQDLEKYLGERGRLIIVEERQNRVEYELKPHDSTPPRRITLLMEDIRRRERMLEVVKENEAVVHLAAQTGVIESVLDPFFDFEQNVLGVLNMLDAAVKHRCPAFVFASSAAPMGNQPPPNREDVAPMPLSPYGAAKLAGEGYCSAFSASFNLPTCALRFSNVYGPYSTFKTSVIAKFFRQALHGETLVIYGDGGQTRDFIHARDLSQAIYRSLKALLENDNHAVSGHIFQIATGVETSINELFGMIRELVERDIGRPVKLEYQPPRAGEIYRNYADISKARATFGFEPEVTIRAGLQDVWNWFKTAL
jgi:UDP-glucose 4-epimerase